MSEYSVEEVKLAARVTRGIYQLQPSMPKIADMLDCLSERIKADEGAVPVGHFIQTSPGNWEQAAAMYAGQPGVIPLFPRPPAQAAQSGRCEWCPVGKLGGTAEPAAQGEVVTGGTSTEAAEAMGAKGGPAVEAERLAFEAWMKGHCWTLGATWRDGAYRSDAEQGGKLCPHAMQTRGLWAAWRDRAALAAQPRAVPDGWQPMETAPRDGSMLRLLVQFEDHATDDTTGPAPTIGAYCETAECWQFAGWCWTHDHFTEGKGTPVGWLPMLAAAPSPGESA